MQRLLIVYASHSGSTREIAQFMSDVLSARGFRVDVRPSAEIKDLSPYEIIIAGGLLYRFGWHPEISAFLKNNLAELQARKVALFVTGMRLGKAPQDGQFPYPIFVDPSIRKAPSDARISNPLDAITTIDYYLKASLPVIERLKPLSLAFFAGKLDLGTLKLPEQVIMLLLMLLTGMRPGDHRNWEAIRAWANSLEFNAGPGSKEDPKIVTKMIQLEERV